MMTYTDWITAIATAISSITSLTLIIFALWQWTGLKDQIREASKARTVSVLLHINSIMHELRPSWHALYKLPDNQELWTTEQRDLADNVGTELQRVAYFVEKDLINSDFVLDSYAKVFVQCWRKLEQYIRNYRVESGEPPTIEEGAIQRRHLEMFVQKCKNYLKNKK